MTLCIAWRNELEFVSFFSDSRVSAYSTFADGVVKVSSIPVCIRDPEKDNEIVYEHSLGLCFCGETVASYSLQLVLTQLMTHLQINPFGKVADLTFESLVDLARLTFDEVSKRFTENELIDFDQLPQFLLTGICPATKRIMLCRIEPPTKTSGVTLKLVLQANDSIMFLGTGADCARKMLLQGNTNLIQLIKDGLALNS
jgi:hypothetical protein